MFREDLEKRLGFKISDSLFKKVLEAATSDIKFNRIGFGKKTSYGQAIDIAVICAKVQIKSL